MAYTGRDCGIHWLGKIYLTGLGEETNSLDSLDSMDGGLFYLVVGFFVWLGCLLSVIDWIDLCYVFQLLSFFPILQELERI